MDKDYGVDGFWYIEDNKIYSHGYAPSFMAAVRNYFRHIPTAFSVRRMSRDIDKKIRAQEKRNAQ